MKNVRVRISLILLIAMLVISFGIVGAFHAGQVQSATAFESADSTTITTDGTTGSAALPDGLASGNEALVSGGTDVTAESEEYATTAATAIKQPVFQVPDGWNTDGSQKFKNHDGTTLVTTITVDPERTQSVRFTGVDMNTDTTTGNLTFAVSNTSYMSYTSTGTDGNKTITVGIVPSTPVGNYTVTFTLKNAGDAWQVTGATTALVYTIQVTKGQVELPKLIDADSDNDHKKTLTYSGSAQPAVFESKYKNKAFTDIFTVTINTNQVAAGNLGNDSTAPYRYNFTATNAGILTITLAIREPAKYDWLNGMTPTTVFTIQVERLKMPDNLEIRFYGFPTNGDSEDAMYAKNPVGKDKEDKSSPIPFHYTHEFQTDAAGNEQHTYYAIYGLTSAMVTVNNPSTNNMNYSNFGKFDNNAKLYKFRVYHNNMASGWPTIGDHTLTITPTANYCWADGTALAKTIKITITKQIVEVPKIVNGHLGSENASTQGLTNAEQTSISYTYEAQPVYMNLNHWHKQVTSVAHSGLTYTTSSTDPTKAYSYSVTNYGTYTVTLRLNLTDRYQWADYGIYNTGTDRTYTFVVNRAVVPDLNILNGLCEDGKTSSGGTDGTTTNLGKAKKVNNATYYNWLDVTYADGANLYLEVKYHPAVSINNTWYQVSGSSGSGGSGLGGGYRETVVNKYYRMWYSVYDGYSCRLRLAINGNYTWEDGTNGTRDYFLFINRKPIIGEHQLSYYGTDSGRSAANKKVVVDKGNAAGYDIVTMNYEYRIPYSDAHRYFSVEGFGLAAEVTLTTNNGTYIVNQGFNATLKTCDFYVCGNVNPYTCVYNIVPQASYCWEDGSTSTRTVTIIVEKENVKVPNKIVDEKIYIDDMGGVKTSTDYNTTVTYTYAKRVYGLTIEPFTNTNIVTASVSVSNGGSGQSMTNNSGAYVNQFHFQAQNAGTYTLNLSLTNTARYQWEDYDEGKTATTRSFTIIIKRLAINGPDNKVNHNIISHGGNSSWANTAPVTVYTGPISAGVIDFYWTDPNSSYMYMLIDGVTDATENFVTVVIDNAENSYNTNYIGNSDFDRSKTAFRFHFYRRDTGIIRTTYMRITPTGNYCWDGAGTYETRRLDIRVNKYQTPVPYLDGMSGDATNDKGEAIDNTLGGKYDEATRTATFTYTGAPIHMYIAGYTGRANDIGYSGGSSSYSNNTPTGHWDFYATNAGTYTINFRFNTSNNYYYDEWATDPDLNPTIAGKNVQIFTLVIERAEVETPTLLYTNNQYSNTADTATGYKPVGDTLTLPFRPTADHYFFIKGYDNAKMSQSMAGPASSNFSRTVDASMGGLKGYITQTNTGYVQVGQFTVTVTPNANHRWKGLLLDEGTKAKVFTIIIEAAKVTVPKFDKSGDESGDASLYQFMKVYDTTAKKASLIDIDSSMVTVSTSGPSGGTAAWSGNNTVYTYTATNAGTYTITVSLRANFSWDDSVTTGTRVYNFVIRRAGITLPEIRYYGLDSTYASSSLQSEKTTNNGAMYLAYNRQGDIYHRFEFTNVNSTNVTIAAGNNTTYQNGSFVSGDGNLYRCWLRQYTTNATRAEGWWWTVTPTDNYAWEVGDGTIDSSARTLTIFLLKVEVEVPELVLPKAPTPSTGEEEGDGEGEVTTPSVPSNYDPATRTFTLTYTGQQQAITFSGYDRNVVSNSIAISDAVSGTSMTSNLVPDSDGYVYFYAINAGTYVITLTVANTNYYQWKGTTVNPVYTIIVQRAEMEIPTFVKLDVSGNPIPNHPDIDQGTRIALETYSVTNTTLSYLLTNFKGSTYYSSVLSNTDLMTQSVDNSAEQNTIILKNYSAADYRITLTPTANYRWKNENWDAKVFTIRVQQKKVALPRIYDATNKTMLSGETLVLTYTGQPQNIMFVPLVTEANNFWESFDATQIRYNYAHVLGTNTVPVQYTKAGETETAMVNYSYVTLTTVGTYNVDVYLANGNYIWADGVKYDNYKRFTVQITQMRLPVLEMEYNGLVEPSNIITVEYSTSPLTFYLKRPAANNGVVSNGGYAPGYSSTYFSGFSVVEETDSDGNKTGNSYYQVTMKPNGPGTYSVTMDTTNNNYHWDGEGGRTQKTYQVIVTKKTIQTPEIYLVEPDPTEANPNNTKDTLIVDGHSVDYTGNIYQIKFKKVHSNEVGISGDLSAAAETGAMWDNGNTTAIRTARNAGTYTITIKISNTNLYQWSSGETTMTQRFIVNPMEVERPEFYTATDVADKDTWTEIVGSTEYRTTFSGINQFVLLKHDTAAAMKFSVATANSSYNLTLVDTTWATDHYVYVYQSQACTYTIRATLQANYAWKGGSTVAAAYTFIIEPKSIVQPSFDEQWFKDNIPAGCSYSIDGLDANVDYTGNVIQAQIKDYDMSVINLKSWYYWNSTNHGSYTPIQSRDYKYISFNNVRYTTTISGGTYYPASITIGLINNNNYRWNTGGVENLTFRLQVRKQNVDVPDMVEVITTTDEDDNVTETYNAFTDNAFTTTYRPEGYDFRIRGIKKSQVTVAFTRAVNLLNGNGISPLPTISWIDGEDCANIHMATAGSYTITVSLISGSYFQWRGTTNTDAKPFTITINRQIITLPTLENGTLQTNGSYLKSVVYDGKPQSLKMVTTQADYFTRTGGTNYT
ncbi:MAG: hypothetical protein K2J16_04615, partial [Clostridia bacterium]|nr:hypothetical protein [Clostridia bacterium]